MQYEPLWGSVAHGGKTFTLYFRTQGNMTAINTQGHNPKLLQGLDIPIIRFDKANLDDVLFAVSGPVIYIKEYHGNIRYSDSVSLKQYIQRLEELDIPIEQGYANEM
jgi:hypothetical protein